MAVIDYKLPSLFDDERHLAFVVESDPFLSKVPYSRRFFYLVRTYLRKYHLDSSCGDLHVNALHMHPRE